MATVEMKKKFLVTYESSGGAGGSAFVFARSKVELREKFPYLDILDPDIDEVHSYTIRMTTLTTDVDNLTGWLKDYYDRTHKKKWWKLI